MIFLGLSTSDTRPPVILRTRGVQWLICFIFLKQYKMISKSNIIRGRTIQRRINNHSSHSEAESRRPTKNPITICKNSS